MNLFLTRQVVTIIVNLNNERYGNFKNKKE